MCCAPSCVVVKWNLERDLNLGFELQFLKVLDALSGRLNLSQRNVSIIGLIIDGTYLDNECSKRRNNIQRPSKYTVTW